MACKSHAPGGETIDVGRPCQIIAGTTEAVGPLLIRTKYYKVGFLTHASLQQV